LSDFHPKGEVTKAYDIWNEERGAGLRALIVVDKNGDIIFREVYAPGKAPDPNDMLAAIEG
jgi:alkyl hydroperoxide reductase subunit AhpC|tara:strand:- start:21064 stop:21246 length:183 start_codon:yes stop_codon:yes gene_type:complete